MVEAPARREDEAARVAQHGSLGDRVDPPARPVEPRAQEVAQAPSARLERRLEVREDPDDELPGDRGGRRAHVGDEVGDRHVDLVADGRHDRCPARGDRARDDLLVEGPQVLERAAAAADDDHVGARVAVRARKPARDLLGRADALDADGHEDDLAPRETAVDDGHEVAHRGPRLRRDEADAPREEGQRDLPRGVEEARGLETPAHLLERQLQGARPERLHLARDQLVAAVGRVDVDRPAAGDLEAVLELEAAPDGGAEEDAGQDRVGVLQREVDVARGDLAAVRDLAADPDARERPGDQVA
jgi:hypothetical protein